MALRKLLSLEEMATSQVAINLCQDDSFKEVALCLEKPSICGFGLWSSPYSDNFEKVEEWDAAIDEQCQKLIKGLPQSLKRAIYIWITRIALEYSSYSRRMELLFGVPRYYFMNNITREDWTETCRLNEMKLAKKLLKNERLTILQRYRIACVYCVHVNIPELWNELTDEEKHSISGNDDPDNSEEKNPFVLLWSYYMDGRRDQRVTGHKNHLWIYATMLAVDYGNRVILTQCWKRLNKHSQKRIVISRAFQSVGKWRKIQKKDKWREKLVLNNYRKLYKESEPIENFNLPSYYGELFHFFLSKMCERQQLKFFEIAYDEINGNQGLSVLRCLSEWPVQDYFLPTMKRLWGITPNYNTPNYMYGQILLTLAEMNTGAYDCFNSSGMFDNGESLYYDYGNVIWNLWEDTPVVYKQHVLCYEKHDSSNMTMIEYFLRDLVERDPLQDKDTALFKRVFGDIPEVKKIELIHSGTGKNIFCQLMKKGKWSFIDWLLQECLSNVEIPMFKKPLIVSHYFYCFMKLEDNCEKYVEDFIDWAFELDTDKMQLKYGILKKGVNSIQLSLCIGKFAEVDRVINFCLSSEQMKTQFKVDIVKKICCYLSKNCAWNQMDKSLSWCFDAEEKIKDFKEDLFWCEGIDIHYSLVFIKKQWENVECFYKWFCLSPEEIINIKKTTLFLPEVFEHIRQVVQHKHAPAAIIASLRWCLTDEEMVFTLKEEVERQYFNKKKTRKRMREVKEQLHYLVSELLCDFRQKLVDNKICKESTFMKDKGQKRSLVMEDESNLPRKRVQQCVQE